MSLKMLLRWELSFSETLRSLISLSTSRRQTLQIKVGRCIPLLSQGVISEVTETQIFVYCSVEAHVMSFKVSMLFLCLSSQALQTISPLMHF